MLKLLFSMILVQRLSKSGKKRIHSKTTRGIKPYNIEGEALN